MCFEQQTTGTEMPADAGVLERIARVPEDERDVRDEEENGEVRDQPATEHRRSG
jgi:hypothetical protein